MDAPDKVARTAPLTPLVLAALLLVLAGCVQRTFVIESTPTGARVLLDGQDIGVTPAEVSFVYYGTRRLDLWLDQPGEDYEVLTEWVELRPSWYERFPVDIVTEVFWPFPRKVVRRHHAVLTPHEPAGPQAVESLLDEAEAVRRSTR